MKAYVTIMKLTLLSLVIAFVSIVVSLQAEAQVRALHIPSASLDIQTFCHKDRAIFKIRNDGARWGAMGEFIVVSEGERQIISRRKMRLAADQVVTFRVPMTKFGAADTIHMALMSGASKTKPIAKAKLSCASK